MKFTRASSPLKKTDIEKIEQSLGIELPKALRQQYLKSNGGTPARVVFVTEDDEITVDYFLPLKSRSKLLPTALEAYRSLQEEKAVPPHFFPFADDPSGDLFLVDTSTPDGQVYFWVHDTAFEPLTPLKVSVGKFWSRLRSDPEA
jgi:hypothetical protein